MAADWSAQLEKLAKQGERDLGELCKAVKIELFSGIVSDTRVGDPSTWQSAPPPGYTGGRLRGNWQIQENTPASGELERIDKDGSVVQAEIESKSSSDGTTYFVNNLPYAKTYEEKDAMIGRNVTRVGQILKRKVREIKK